MNQIDRRRFPVSSRYSDDEKSICGTAIEWSGNICLSFLKNMIKNWIFEDRISFIITNDLFNQSFHRLKREAKENFLWKYSKARSFYNDFFDKMKILTIL